MTAYRPKDINQQTVLCKDGGPSMQMVCLTLHEAVIQVKNHWSKDDQERERASGSLKGDTITCGLILNATLMKAVYDEA
jgi:hypothetical protein